MKKLSRAAFENPIVQGLLSRIGATYIRFVHATTRWNYVNREAPAQRISAGEPFVLAAWHGRIGMLVYTFEGPAPQMHPLISDHRDGELITRTIEHFGYRTIRGSSNDEKKGKDKGGARALRQMVKALRSGEYVCVTPDGPRGPRMRMKEGLLTLAYLSKAPIVPVAYSVKRRIVLNSWDRFIVPLPFNRGIIVWGDPMHFDRPDDESSSTYHLRSMEDALNAVTRQADEAVGGEVIEPAGLLGSPKSA